MMFLRSEEVGLKFVGHQKGIMVIWSYWYRHISTFFHALFGSMAAKPSLTTNRPCGCGCYTLWLLHAHARLLLYLNHLMHLILMLRLQPKHWCWSTVGGRDTYLLWFRNWLVSNGTELSTGVKYLTLMHTHLYHRYIEFLCVSVWWGG